QSLRCLEELGVLIRSERVLRLLEDSGVDVDYDKQLARISEDIVVDAVKKAPKEVTLSARDPKHDMKIPVQGIPYAANSGLATYMTDLDSGERRNASRADLADFARLVDALDSVDFFWTAVVPMDVPDRSHATHQLWTSLQNVTKHVQQVEVMDAEDAKTQIALASLVAGGKEELRKMPLFSVVCSPVSPMSFEKCAAEAQVELSKAGIPIVSMTMPLSGLTSPVTVGGTINLVNTENLASLVISQTAAEGSPFIYSSAAVPGDMRTGEADFGAVELPFITAGLGQMADRYGIPRMIGDWGLCNGLKPGIDKSFSEVSSVALDTFSGADLLCGMGSLDGAKGVSLEQLVIDAYTWKNWRLFLRSVVVDEQAIAFDVLREVGHGGTFLSHPHTLKNFKTALASRDATKLSWEATLSDRMVPEAREITKRILSEHKVDRLDSKVIQDGDALMRRFEGL
ncbi:MAG: trimethylamine methyltransferase family protein, partial [Thermoplasmata archaeon]